MKIWMSHFQCFQSSIEKKKKKIISLVLHLLSGREAKIQINSSIFLLLPQPQTKGEVVLSIYLFVGFEFIIINLYIDL